MRTLTTVLSFLLLFMSSVRADDTDILKQIYQIVHDEYVLPVDIEDLAVPALKALSKIDKNISVADDDRRMSIYVNRQLVKTLRKPKDGRDVQAWAKFSNNMIKAAKKHSKELSGKDFEIIDTIMVYGVKAFDADSTYYPELELSNPPQPEFKIKRAFYERMLSNDILYVRLGAINQHTRANVVQSLQEHPDVKGLVIDVRGNPGGILKEAVELAGMLLDGGIVASVKGRQSDAVEYYNAPEGDILNDKPIVVLIDGKTASSAEVFAAALQEQSRATVVGTTSYGKGTVQKLTKLDNDSRLTLTNGLIYTPSGKKLAGKGILPDICTFEEQETRDPEKIIARGNKSGFCGRQEHDKSELDIDVAHAYLIKTLNIE